MSDRPPISGQTRVYAVIGHPVHHSASPAMHNAWFAHHGVDALYVALDTPRPVPDLARVIADLGFAGANLTIPHKTAMVEQVDQLGPDGAACGAINTVVRRDDGLYGYNTDVGGFAAALDELGVDVSGQRVQILGAGGAALAVATAVTRAGATELLVANRSLAGIAALANRVDVPVVAQMLGPELDLAPDLRLIVNTLPAAASDQVRALDPDRLDPGCAWVDLNYWDPDPPHLAALGRRGHPVQTGHRMLLHQAALAFAHFVGIRPELALGADQVSRHGSMMATAETSR